MDAGSDRRRPATGDTLAGGEGRTGPSTAPGRGARGPARRTRPAGRPRHVPARAGRPPAARPGAGGRRRQRRVTFAAPQLPSASTARTYTATFDARLRSGRTIPAADVRSVAIFHGPPLTEYWTR